jgi:DNA invertase Pin-like site-specific DNA recombinase
MSHANREKSGALHDSPPSPPFPRVFGYVVVVGAGCAAEEREAQIEQQHRLIDAYFEEQLKPRGFAWGGLFGDGHDLEQRLTSRPEGARLSAAAERGEIVIVARTAGAFWSLKDMVTTVRTWAERGVAVHLADLGVDTSSETGRTVLGLLGAVVGMDRLRRGARVREALAERRRAGMATHRPPIGMKVLRGRFVPCEYTRAVMRKIFEWKTKGYTWETIYHHLHKSGIRQRNGKVWSYGLIQRAFHAEGRRRLKEGGTNPGPILEDPDQPPDQPPSARPA